MFNITHNFGINLVCIYLVIKCINHKKYVHINFEEKKTLIPQSHLLYGGRTVAVELQNRVIPAVAVEILRWPQGHRMANPYVLQAAGVAVEL